MVASRFDRLARGAQPSLTRRAALGLLVGGVVGAAPEWIDAAPKAPKKKPTTRKAATCTAATKKERCGDGCCPKGYVCCNALAGICARPGQTCGQ